MELSELLSLELLIITRELRYKWAEYLFEDKITSRRISILPSFTLGSIFNSRRILTDKIDINAYFKHCKLLSLATFHGLLMADQHMKQTACSMLVVLMNKQLLYITQYFRESLKTLIKKIITIISK